MPEVSQNRQIYSLHEIAQQIQEALSVQFPSAYWIKAELNKLNYYVHSGHCYPELVEKKDGRVIAQMRSVLWRTDYIRVNSQFKQVLNEPLKDGIKILFLANIVFHPEYGLSLRILDIDPGYTLGDLEKEKQETIRELRAEGIYDQNKKLPFPLLPQRLAIISVESSKGYADFMRIIRAAEEDWNYRFFPMLFPSLLQGDDAVPSMIRQLRQIRKVKHHFDVVAIIRGGGGDIGLSCYNHFQLAKEIAQFPLPVITGIGHATNETVSEMVAFENAITPTKLAEMIIQKYHDFSVPVQGAQEKIVDYSRKMIADEKKKFTAEIRLFRNVSYHLIQRHKTTLRENTRIVARNSQFMFRNERETQQGLVQKLVREVTIYCTNRKHDIARISQGLPRDSQVFLKSKNQELASLESNLNNLKPENVLKRGYSITYLNEHSVTDSSKIKPGDLIHTQLFNGTITSTVHTTSNLSNHE